MLYCSIATVYVGNVVDRDKERAQWKDRLGSISQSLLRHAGTRVKTKMYFFPLRIMSQIITKFVQNVKMLSKFLAQNKTKFLKQLHTDGQVFSRTFFFSILFLDLTSYYFLSLIWKILGKKSKISVLVFMHDFREIKKLFRAKTTESTVLFLSVRQLSSYFSSIPESVPFCWH